MSNKTPRVSIGMPVYNGERFIARALESILAQTFDDFELIISDNASEDATQEICLEYAARDGRIRYYRNEANLGASKNFNRVFELSIGEYFKWAAHDDWIAPEYLRRCIETLDREPNAVLCYPKTVLFDEDGRFVGNYDDPLDASSPKTHERFHRLVWSLKRPYAIFGVMRADALKRTNLFRNTLGADRPVLAELCLIGPICRIPEPLFFSTNSVSVRNIRTSSWFDPANKRRLMLRSWRLCHQHLMAVKCAPLSRVRKLILMIDVLVRYTSKDGRLMVADVKHAAKQVLSRHRV